MRSNCPSTFYFTAITTLQALAGPLSNPNRVSFDRINIFCVFFFPNLFCSNNFAYKIRWKYSVRFALVVGRKIVAQLMRGTTEEQTKKKKRLKYFTWQWRTGTDDFHCQYAFLTVCNMQLSSFRCVSSSPRSIWQTQMKSLTTHKLVINTID